MTERLYYHDSYQRAFQARVIESREGGRVVYLDRTAFYPTSGGQPCDTGTLDGIRVVDVSEEEDRIAHRLEAALNASEVTACIDWERRYDHMQQHSGQHLLSAVFEEQFKFPTLSFHMGAAVSTIELGTAALTADQVGQAEERCAELAGAAIPIRMTFENATAELGLRKASSRSGVLRIISIGEIDRSACGGTHLRSTAEAGPILIRKSEKVRGNIRIEFVCGLRALRLAAGDFQKLSEMSKVLSVPIDAASKEVTSLAERVKSLEKNCNRLSIELASREGRELFAAIPPGADGVRRVRQEGSMGDEMRTRAQAFVSAGPGIFLAVCQDPPSLMLAASPESGIHAGDRMKAAVAAVGGRGGGNQTLAQGSVPSRDALKVALEQLAF